MEHQIHHQSSELSWTHSLTSSAVLIPVWSAHSQISINIRLLEGLSDYIRRLDLQTKGQILLIVIPKSCHWAFGARMAEIPALTLHPGLLATVLKHHLKAKANLPVAEVVSHLLTSRESELDHPAGATQM